ncbi:hypothetical protein CAUPRSCDRAFT_11759, partial [Caulochytrium protostelioides]
MTSFRPAQAGHPTDTHPSREALRHGAATVAASSPAAARRPPPPLTLSSTASRDAAAAASFGTARPSPPIPIARPSCDVHGDGRSARGSGGGSIAKQGGNASPDSTHSGLSHGGVSVTDSALEVAMGSPLRIDLLARLPIEIAFRVLYWVSATPKRGAAAAAAAAAGTAAAAAAAAAGTPLPTPAGTSSTSTSSTALAVAASTATRTRAARELARCMAVSRTWHRIASDPAFWRAAYDAAYPEDAAIGPETPAWRLALCPVTPDGGNDGDVGREAPSADRDARPRTPDARAASPDATGARGPEPVVQVGIEVAPFGTLLAAAAAASAASSPQASPLWSAPLHSASPAAATPAAAVTTPTTPAGAIPWTRRYALRLALARNWREGRATRHRLLGHADNVYCIQLAGDVVVSGSRDQTVCFWDLRTMQAVRRLTGHTGSVLCLQFNTRCLVTGSSDQTVIVWDLMGRRLRTLRGHTGAVLDVRIND